MAGSDGLRLKIAPINTPVTLRVCLSPVCLCIIERLGAPVCISVRAHRRAHTGGRTHSCALESACVCVQVFLAAENFEL